jgi:hypothetical protein
MSELRLVLWLARDDEAGQIAGIEIVGGSSSIE